MLHQTRAGQSLSDCMISWHKQVDKCNCNNTHGHVAQTDQSQARNQTQLFPTALGEWAQDCVYV